jgi:hypoxanthine-DNA glycosylase
MTELLAGDLNCDYQQRCQMLIEHQIALWDVLQSCRRHSSLDADIEPASMISNQFVAFFAEHRQIETVFFNGATAEQSFKRQVLPNLERELRLIKLPSTSPAHAAMSFEQKLQQWRVIVD